MMFICLAALVLFASLSLQVDIPDHLTAEEREALQIGKRMLRRPPQLLEAASGRWLCSTFLKDNQTEFDILLKNAAVLPCDWAVVFYTNSSEKRPMQSQLCESLRNVSTVRHCQATVYNEERYRTLVSEYTAESPAKQLMYPEHTNYVKKLLRMSKPGQLFIAKQLMYPELLPYLPDYEDVVMMDSDMLFATRDFNFSQAQHIWRHGYKRRLLVAQPTVIGEIEFEVFKHLRWSTQAHVAIGIEFIEQQAYLVNSLVLEWLIRTVLLAKSFDYHALYQSDWGFDSILCQASKAFSSVVLERSIDKRSENPVCAILTRQGVVHSNTKSIVKSHHFIRSGHHIKDLYKHWFPHWTFDTTRLLPEVQGVVHWDAMVNIPN